MVSLLDDDDDNDDDDNDDDDDDDDVGKEKDIVTRVVCFPRILGFQISNLENYRTWYSKYSKTVDDWRLDYHVAHTI